MRGLRLYMGGATKSIGAGILTDGNFKTPTAQCVLAISVPFACTVPIIGRMA